MKRITFLKSLALLPAAGAVMKLSSLYNWSQSHPSGEKMPVMFMGHGSPMNAIEENEFVRGFREMGEAVPTPSAVLCISAHWETRGTYVTAMENPPTIHDFGGFPKALFDVQYPAPGSPELAKETQSTVHKTQVGLDDKWGLDHGAWSVIKHLYPKADVPVIQLSLDYTKDAPYHYDLAKELAVLRSKGVLIIGSGNMVHNLGMVAWDRLNETGFGYQWAIEASEQMKAQINSGDHAPLINFRAQGRAFDLSIPTPEHYLPLLYILALQDKDEMPVYYNDKAVGGSLTMTSVKMVKV
ncbi:MAG: 4,5-DOPA dioxygenase extradiol [Bacteroidetes bacterium]|nr:4,5-DOPA dioxygenase extradiol [Bacteroidota bacterium]